MQAMAQDMTLICLYVDNLLVTGNNINNLLNFKKLMMKEFEMLDMGKPILFHRNVISKD